jgi:Ca2+-binding RTX toxin-like protein
MANFIGTAGDDVFKGGTGDDSFDLTLGGADIAKGAGGDDVFVMGEAFSADDQIDGGAGDDTLLLDGDYAAGLVLGPRTMVGIETVGLAGGHDYALTFDDANFGAGLPTLTVDTKTFAAGDTLMIDGSDVTRGLFDILGGAGADTLTGGSQGDSFNLRHGGRDDVHGGGGDDTFFEGALFKAGVSLDGGSGNDILVIDASLNLEFAAGTMQNVEEIDFWGGLGHLVLKDANVAAGAQLTLRAVGRINFDGSADSDGHMYLIANEGDNTLICGGGSDTISGGRGDDTAIGGAGDDVLGGWLGEDKLVGGLGQDTLTGGEARDRFFYLSTAESTPDAPDTITDLAPEDTIYLQKIDANVDKPGNQHFHLVDHFTGHGGQLVLSFDSGENQTSLTGDVDGDGEADFLVLIDGDHTDFTDFVF